MSKIELMLSTINVKKRKFRFVKVLIHSQLLHVKFFLSGLCAYLFNLLSWWWGSIFWAYTPLCKEFNEHSWKRVHYLNKRGWLCLTKGYLGNQEGQVKIEYPLIQICFWHVWFKLRKTFFSKRALFKEESDPQILYLSKIGLDL